jgi:hypothetical protein
MDQTGSKQKPKLTHNRLFESRPDKTWQFIDQSLHDTTVYWPMVERPLTLYEGVSKSFRTESIKKLKQQQTLVEKQH